MKLNVIKTDSKFVPIGNHEEIDSLINGKEYLMEIKKVRNPKFHRKAFALLNTIYSNQDSFDNFEWFRFWITMKAGFSDTAIAPNGQKMYKAKSLSFESMDDIDFQKWYEAVITVAIKEYGLDENSLNQILEFA